VTIKELRRLDTGSVGTLFLVAGIVVLFQGPYFIILVNNFAFQLDSATNVLYFALLGVLVIVGAIYLISAVQLLRPFSVTAEDQGFSWQRPAFGLGRSTVHASWRDARAFVTIKASKDGKSGDVDEIFMLDTTTEALAWRITPKTPASVREAHERFVRMANEHVQLRDITASLKNLLESPETRSFEYAVTALSGPAPVPPAVRKVLTTPIRESHFLRGYLIVAAILLALLVAAGLLLQSGVIPAGSF
jgi:hypothetical protein